MSSWKWHGVIEDIHTDKSIQQSQIIDLSIALSICSDVLIKHHLNSPTFNVFMNEEMTGWMKI